MEKKNSIPILKIVIEAFMLSAFAAGVTIFVGWVTKANLVINVTTPVLYQQQYVSTIDIKNFSKNSSLKEIELYFTSDNPLISYMAASNSIKDEGQSKLIINSIAPDSSTSIVVYTKEPLTSTSFKVVSSAINSTTFLSKQVSISRTLILATILNIILLSVLVAVNNYLSEKRRFEIDSIFQNKGKQTDAVFSDLQQQINISKKETAEALRIQKETQIYYAIRLSDYAKELTFWKDTVRKILYSFGESKKDVSSFFDSITDSIKTYTTKEVCKQDFEVIQYIAQRIAERSPREKEKEE